MKGNIQQLIEQYRLPGNQQVALKDIRVDHGTFKQVWERYENGIQELMTGISKLGFLPTSVIILIDLGNGVYSVVDGNHRLIAVFRLKDKGEEIPALPGLMDGTMTVMAIVLRADTPDKFRWHIGAMINYSNETNIPNTPYDTYISMRWAITFTNSGGKLLTNADIVTSFEGTPHVITQINSWVAVARYYHVVPNFDSILCTDSVTNRPNYRLPIGVVYAEGAVKGQLVDKNLDLAGWTDDKKEQGRELIIEGTFSEQHTRAEVIAELATMLEITRKGSTGGKGKEKGNSSTSANLPAMDADPKTFDMTVEPKEDNNARGASKSSKEETEATPKQKKQRPTRKLTNPVAIPITHIVEPDSLEAALTAFASQQGATTSVVIIDFPSPDDADKQRLSLAPRFQANLHGLQLLALNKILTQGGVLIERIDMAKFGAMKSNYQTAGAPTSATIHFAFQSAPISKGNLPNESTLFGATNNVAHYAVTSRSPALLNWAKGSHWHRSWANSNLFGPCTVPDVDIVKYVTLSQSKKGEKKLPFFTQQVPSALWMELITLGTLATLGFLTTTSGPTLRSISSTSIIWQGMTQGRHWKDVNPFLDVEAGVEGGEEESEGSDTNEETPSDKDMIDDGDEGDQGAGKGGDDENLPPLQPGKPPVGAETRPTQNLTQSVHAIHQHAGQSGVVVDLQVGGGDVMQVGSHVGVVREGGVQRN
ncbi:hypothetical protein M427DRAFT_39896 [Gonapodya prolifera JEL478]|uniref:ParB/Sulfiredoxin domain-containing protein n=1 Tax=Gonapodya prolifera (strain JEL478) TaxID=1344416 RepID=A0A138ZWE5_GONPJ|nr:hypothetical protein M427DRAFT_39896 [Gonapodya prolifera JEL478]|eukprot:KXS08838.1 hypothetical protein M427DRAFT_39896 [Gonapodya prolifera JEL478]